MRAKEWLAYTAGIIDGEGYITLINKQCVKSWIAQVGITNTNEWLIQWFKMRYGGAVTTYLPYKINWKRSYRWKLEHKKAVEFIKLIYPYLNLKKPQADVVISFCSRRRKGGHYNENENALNEAQKILIRKLNKRGVETK